VGRPTLFGERRTVEQVEEGSDLAPKFDADGMIPAVTTDFASGELLMHAYMNAEALTRTIQTGEAHYFSRSRQAIWHKGATSGLVQKVVELLIDDDQDCVWLRVDVAGGASCHVGYRSCFYRKIPESSLRENAVPGRAIELEFTETEKIFDPEEVYPGVPNPTKL
jgi:phosphoribosyl-AMP cyclohydrolase